jgi:regulator of sigma E protease
MIEILNIIITIGLTIFVHELGHFIAAKKVGVKVEKFSIGWGPKLFSFKKDGTEYMIALFFFLGGYVKMAGEAPEEAEAAGDGGFLKQAPWKKILISFAGVVQNAVFAVILMWVVFLAGTDALKPVVDDVKEGYPAYDAGIKRGDEITSINGEKITYWNDITDVMSRSGSLPLEVRVLRDGKEVAVKLTPKMEETEDIIKDKKTKPVIGIGPIAFIPVVDEVKKGSPAESAGMKRGDRITAINGKSVTYWEDLTDAVRSSNGGELSVSAQRDGKELALKITPKKEMIEDQEKKKVETYIIGIIPQSNVIKEHYGPVKALVKGAGEAWYFTDITVKSIGKMVTRKLEPDVAGPIGVAQIAYKVAKTGFINLLLLVAIININLALFNLLPIVPFDGGLILLFIIEAVAGKPVPLKVQNAMMEVGWALVMLLIVFVTYSDIARIVKGG